MQIHVPAILNYTEAANFYQDARDNNERGDAFSANGKVEQLQCIWSTPATIFQLNQSVKANSIFYIGKKISPHFKKVVICSFLYACSPWIPILSKQAPWSTWFRLVIPTSSLFTIYIVFLLQQAISHHTWAPKIPRAREVDSLQVQWPTKTKSKILILYIYLKIMFLKYSVDVPIAPLELTQVRKLNSIPNLPLMSVVFWSLVFCFL